MARRRPDRSRRVPARRPPVDPWARIPCRPRRRLVGGWQRGLPAPGTAAGLVARARTQLWRSGPARALAESEGPMRAHVHIPVAILLVLLVTTGIPATGAAADAPSEGLKPGDVVDDQT